ncbi:MAG: type II toxin-antitoxin system RelB/DinJ family antitoxin [Oscillospiraceae bacterium]|jgi:DNA-damage-inducible protein J|nr:type II toxin-antitoxin system RelB/DinJ family antitoxin [Oscillospiraceae bacterium]
MASTTNLNVRVNGEIKSQADSIFAELGLNTSAAINIFLRYCVRHAGIPFELRLDSADATKRAFRNVRNAFEGEAERLGLQDEQDVVALVDEIRAELWEERNANPG